MVTSSRTITALLIAGQLAACTGSDAGRVAQHEGTVRRYCLDCHNDAERTGDLTLQSRDLARVRESPEIWERVVRKLRGGMMPPADAPRPKPAERLGLAAWLEAELDSAAAASPNPGRTVPFHRLNRSEYRNAIRDLLALEIDVGELLPADDASYGFDNIAGVLKLSPTLLERYLSAADQVSRLAVGSSSQFVDIDYFRIPDDRAQDRRVPGLPFGTRGGTSIPYTFPVDGDYVIAAELSRNLNESMPLYAEPQHLEISIDGERVALFTLDGVPASPPPEPEPVEQPAAKAEGGDAPRQEDPRISQIVQTLRLSPEARALRNRADEDWNIRIPITAGLHDVTVTFLAKTAAIDETLRLPFLRPYPSGVNIPETRMGSYLRSVEISGPYAASGPGDTQSRRRIFACMPDRPSDAQAPGEDELVCARSILSSLARRGYRRSVTDRDVEDLLEFFVEGRADGGFEAGVQLALKRLLVSPEFLFRIEIEPRGIEPDAIYEIDEFALASRLSFFLWSSIPDDELLDLAEQGALRAPGELPRQIARMIADERADAFVENFAGQWLFLRNLEAIVPVQSRFPDFDDTLRQGLRTETELFFASILRENRSVRDLLTADYTFLNERVARHYGIANVKGSHFRRVSLDPDSHRRGLLGHGSILAVTSYPDRTSPVIRGKWVLENLLGTPPPPPLPDVPRLVETDGKGSVISMRERLAAHRASPTCASCHALMDPLGFALENYDAVGKWRTIGEAGARIDASGVLPDGRAFDGVDGLRESLLSSELFVTTLTEKMLTYALGRGVEYYDMPVVRKIVADAASEDYRMSALIEGIVESVPFKMRRSGP
jgi:hypothetical protein